jgi:lipoprotein NlpI
MTTILTTVVIEILTMTYIILFKFTLSQKHVKHDTSNYKFVIAMNTTRCCNPVRIHRMKINMI